MITNSSIYHHYHHHQSLNSALYLEKDILLVPLFKKRYLLILTITFWKYYDKIISMSWRWKQRLEVLWFTWLQIMKCQNQIWSLILVGAGRGGGGGECLREIKFHFDSKMNLTKRSYLKITKWTQTHFPNWKLLPLTKHVLYCY